MTDDKDMFMSQALASGLPEAGKERLAAMLADERAACEYLEQSGLDMLLSITLDDGCEGDAFVEQLAERLRKGRPVRVRARLRRSRPQPARGVAVSMAAALTAAALLLLSWAFWGTGRRQAVETVPEASAAPVAVAAAPVAPGIETVAAGPAGTEALETAAPPAETAIELAGPPEETAAAPPAWPEGATVLAPAPLVTPAPEAAPPPPPAAAVTAQPLGSILVVAGSAYYARAAAGEWFEALEGVHLISGDSIETRRGRMRLALAEGSNIYCNSNTQAAFEAPGIRLNKGEVYCDVAAGAAPFTIASRDCTVRCLGTRVAVKVLSSSTVVTVEEGRVEVGNDNGSISVAAGFQVTVREGREPGRLVPVNTALALAWLDTINKVLLYHDFNSGRRPPAWASGTVSKGPQSSIFGLCLMGQADANNPKAYSLRMSLGEPAGLTYSDDLVLSLDYRISNRACLLSVRVTDETQKATYSMDYDQAALAGFERDNWGRLVIRLRDMQTCDKTRRIMPGDALTALEIIVKNAKKNRPFYVDNVAFVLCPPGRGLAAARK